MERYIFGVDLGGTTIKIGLFTASGALVDKWEIPTRTANSGENILPDIAAALYGKMAERGIDVDQICGVGLGVPGAVINDSFVKPCVNLQQWGNFDVAEALSRLCGATVKVANDANAATLGELFAGAGRGYENMVLLTLGTGVGGGVVVNGHLLRGVHGAAGELGHMKIHDDCPVTCGCGCRGCLEQYASATGIVRCAKEALAAWEGETTLRGFGNMTCKDVFDSAKAGDELACQVVDNMGRDLAKGMANVSAICDPQVFVIGGGVSKAGDIIIDAVKKHFDEYVFPASRETDFMLAQLGNDAGIYGTAFLIMDEE